MAELTLDLFGIDCVPQVGFLVEHLDQHPPVTVNKVELGFFGCELLFDVVTREYWFKVHPCPLTLNPILECVLDQDNLIIELVGLAEDSLDVL